MFVALLLAALVAVSAVPPFPRDHAIAASVEPTYLDGAWTLTNHYGRKGSHPLDPVQATVPGDILTDLQRAGRVGDPYYDMTWRTPAFIAAWNRGTWTYAKTFRVLGTGGNGTAAVLLVLEGVRMGAMVHVNNHFLGNTTNQFTRYTFSLPPSQVAANEDHVLTITFGSDLKIPTGGRFTFAGQIDWVRRWDGVAWASRGRGTSDAGIALARTCARDANTALARVQLMLTSCCRRRTCSPRT